MPEEAYQQVAQRALSLSSTARARLARELLRSLEPSAEAEIDRLWVEEAARRDRELDAGDDGIPIEQVLERARAALK